MMRVPVPIIDTKLTPPMIKKNWIRRPAIMKRLHRIPEYPLTILRSGAGYGKSSALSLFANDFRGNVCWYTISANDDDILPFILHTVHMIRKRYHLFGDDFLTYFDSLENYRDVELQMLSSRFIRELEKVNESVILIFDDYHLVDHSFPINQWMKTVIEHLPKNIHIVISSRRKMKWGFITKWKVSGKLLEINDEYFKVSLEETDLLLRDFYNLPLTEQEITSIYMLTEGWIIALSMIAEHLKNGVDLSSILHYHHSSMNDLFDYLVEEVFSKQPVFVQQFLKRAALLEQITANICDEIFDMHNSKAILEQLTEQNAFIYQLNGTNDYRFHSLFKTAVERKLKQEDEHLYVNIHWKSARFYEQKQMWEQAIDHYEKIGDQQAIANLLEKHAKDILNNGKLEYLADRLKNIPDHVKDQSPTLWLYEGEVQRYLSFYDKAKKSYQHTIELVDIKKDWQLAGRAIEGMASIYIDTIQPVIAERYLSEAIHLTEKHLGKNDPSVRKLYGYMIENLVNRGNVTRAEKYVRSGLFPMEQLKINNLDARLYLRSGKLEKAKNILYERLNDHQPSLPQTHRETEVLLAYIESCLGNGEQAKKLSEKGINQGMKLKNPFVEAVGWMRLGHASQITDYSQFDDTEQHYLKSLKLMEKIHVSRGKAEPYMGLCLLYGKKNDFERSKKMGQMGLYETEKVNDFWLSSFIYLSLGIAALTNKQMKEAQQFLRQAEQYFQQYHDPYGYTLTQLWMSVYYFQEENWPLFKQSMDLLLREIQIGHYDFIFQKKTLYGPSDLQNFIPLFLKGKELNVQPSYIHHLLLQFGYEKLDSHPGYTLKINTFGSFQLFLGNREITDKDWQRMKAKELFLFLLVHKNRWWSKEEIYEQLWPNAKINNIDNEFKVILNSLNKTLEPNRKARSSSFYILRVQNKYRINPNAVMAIDFEQFDRWIYGGLQEKSPEKAIPLLLKGLKLYKGPFLADIPSDTNFATLREHFRNLFLRGAEKLAQLFVQTNETDRAIDWCERILAVDNAWEEAYRLLMYCHYQKNNRPVAIHYYKKLCTILKKEYGLEPMEATVQMYEMILQADEIGL
ncbi:BTAD domain-containing putative transcriptional regulator [Fervidibacillus albus]|uniref:Transcriptional regulator n=1 Tax=Fervidibacillus albus TaxID=2980026 RepID=A0A9E8LSV5_9BACI|nr:BTAD domain-containing putative transcriptional regulator [Fervidibacillus albus]WAA08765.1 transcriptional regulator [Fervidibacillus albus]